MLNMFINSTEYLFVIKFNGYKKSVLIKKSNIIASNPTKCKISYKSYEIWEYYPCDIKSDKYLKNLNKCYYIFIKNMEIQKIFIITG
jgi:hypothetical protein